MSAPTIRLDTSKKYSTVHGDRTPDDPHYRVHFFQGGLPFDAKGILVPDDGKTAPYTGTGPDGKPTLFAPLYDLGMRERLQLRHDRLAVGRAAPTLDDLHEEDDDVDQRRVAEEVNLISWLRGEVNYEPPAIFAACSERYGRRHQKLRSVVEDLVLDEKIVPESEVAPHLMRLIDTPASASI